MEIGIGISLVVGFLVLALWFLRARAARGSRRDAVAKKEKKAAQDNLNAVQKAIRGRR